MYLAEYWKQRQYTHELESARAMRADWANLRAAVNHSIRVADVDVSSRIVTAVAPMLWFSIEHEVGAWAMRVLDVDGVREHRLGTDLADLVANSLWWLGDIDGMENYIEFGEQLPTYAVSRSPLTGMRALLMRHQGDLGGQLDLLRQGDSDSRASPRRNWIFGIDSAQQSPHQNLSEAHACLSALRADASETGSLLIKSMADQVESTINVAGGDVAAAADLARSAIDAAIRGGSLFHAHINAFALGFCSELAQQSRTDDLRYFERTLREQRDAGQRTDLWLTLAGLILLIDRVGGEPLAHDIHRSLLASPWATHPLMDLSMIQRFGDDGNNASQPQRNLDDIVDEVLDVLHHLIDQA